MAQRFNLVAELQLAGPKNLNTIVSNIQKAIGNIRGNVDIRIDKATSRNIGAITTSLKALNRELLVNRSNAAQAAQAMRTFSDSLRAPNANNVVKGINQISTASGRGRKNIHDFATEMEAFGFQAGLAARRFSAFVAPTAIVFGLVRALRAGV